MRLRPHATALCLFPLFALGWTWPLMLNLSSHLPGEHVGDNAQFAWNVWWMREALGSADARFFRTDMLFAPFGADLTLHTHTWLPAFLGATALAALPPVTAGNILILAAVAANGLAMYALAFDRSGDRGGAMVAGLIFAGAPYLTAHLLGHFNLINAWGLPLFVLFLMRTLEQRAWRASIAAGLCLAAIAYCDYYYLVYALVLATGLVVARIWAFEAGLRRTPIPRLPGLAVSVLLVLALAVVVAIVATGGFVVRAGGVVISARQVTNPLAATWVLLAILLFLRHRPWIGIARRTATAAHTLRAVLPGALVALAFIFPLAWMGASLWSAGGYVSPPHSWRSGPAGVDLATLVLGNPFHPIWGSVASGWYERFGIDRIEGGGWLGLAPAGVALFAAVRLRNDPEIRRWLAIAAAFFLWGLGPWLVVAGFNTGVLLPQNLLSLLPVLSNARMPGRAMVIVFMGLSVLAALTLSRIEHPRRRALIAVVGLAILLDYLPAPFPVTAVRTPGLYAQVGAHEAPGAVCELPVGIRDGFGTIGSFDDTALLHQMTHRRPIVGGFAARVAPAIKEGYERLPVVRSLFSLSEGGDVAEADRLLAPDEAGAALRAAGIAFIVLDRARASDALVRFVEDALPLRLLAVEGQRESYVVVRRGGTG